MTRPSRIRPHLAAIILAAPAFAFASPARSADQAECEAAGRALMAPYGDNAPEQTITRFGTSVTQVAGQEMKGFSLQTADGSVYYDQDKNPVSLSLINGDVYTTTDGGKSWTLANSTSKEVMDQVIAGIVSQAEKATSIACEYGVDLDGKTVDHFAADYELYNTGTPIHSEYWVDPETRFVWKDVMHSKGTPEIIVTTEAEPAPEMTLPDPKG